MSDGYHTFDELYDHRNLLFINLCLASPEKAKIHICDNDWFLLFLETSKGQISYHIPAKYVSLVADKIQVNHEYKWDGHTSQQVLERLTPPEKE